MSVSSKETLSIKTYHAPLLDYCWDLQLYEVCSRKKSCLHFAQKHFMRSSASIIVLNVWYRVGGTTPTKILPITLAADLHSTPLQLVQKANMNKGRSCTTLVNYANRFLYAIGGYVGIVTSHCELYDIAKNKWYNVPPLNEPKFFVSACVMGERIYCFGGSTLTGLSNKIERLDPLDGQWCYITCKNMELPAGLGAGSCAISQKEILVLGGHDDFPMDTIYVVTVNYNNAEVRKMNATLPTATGFATMSNTVMFSGKVYCSGCESRETVGFDTKTRTCWRIFR